MRHTLLKGVREGGREGGVGLGEGHGPALAKKVLEAEFSETSFPHFNTHFTQISPRNLYRQKFKIIRCFNNYIEVSQQV